MPDPKKLRVLSLFSGIGGFDLGLERAGMQVVGMVEIDRFRRAVLKTRWPQTPLWDDVRTLTFSSAASRAKTSRSRASSEESEPSGADFSSSLLGWQRSCGLVGSFLKTSLVSCLQTKVRTSRSSSQRSPNAGMVWHGACWTASISESPRRAAASTLSGILTTRAPQRYCLSAKEAASILRRAGVVGFRGKMRRDDLPPRLRLALENLVEEGSLSSSKGRPSAANPKPGHSTGKSGRTAYATPSTPPSGTRSRSMMVRKLTPVEWERLQGFPDGWTIPATPLWGTPTRFRSLPGSGSGL